MNRRLSFLLLILILGLLVLLVVQVTNSGILSFIQKAKNTKDMLQQATPSPLQEQESSKPTNINSRAQTENAIITNINSKNFQGLSAYMKEGEIGITYMSSECCLPQNAQEALKQLNYINTGIPLNFNQNSPEIKNLKTKNPQLVEAYIGISNSTEHLAAFYIDNNNKISAIQLAVSWKLYTN